MKALNNAQYVQKRSAQSDVKTEQRNKQVSNLTKKYQNRVDKAAETTNTVYLRERATLLQDIKRLNIEYDIFKRQYDKEKESGKTVDAKVVDEHANQADEVFKFLLIPDDDDPDGLQFSQEDMMDPKIKRLKLLQLEHEKQIKHRMTVFYRDVEEDKKKQRELKSNEETEDLSDM
ncbi:uncharacterized protein LOC142348765 [Convolutriloba macropyga]|uniref:uncharacterized protein LOC142343851 n=1 Tax=Convolutriloba macropyga TaxID=536237 RepID=UPI003F521DE0